MKDYLYSILSIVSGVVLILTEYMLDLNGLLGYGISCIGVMLCVCGILCNNKWKK